ncbi:Na+/H+ antiporter NhaC [Sinanaerobacter sp. ZZT-01]|uniref:Na+/H+ antiporter NhaC n=1 Tax=Sinanaerobacter sp. ZZT-01 TaxID=3111540 RepID=UPI002D79CA55|nr:Na+/H+ antiporter NhaC [Sinanaerobacter sp. ZZT-01]WRR94831.1 Na+/H+ antiporter NhaC [Sinanaerobacter sp. ZZT-01]
MGRKIPIWQTFLVVVLSLGVIIYSIVFSYGESHMPLIMAAIIAAAVGALNGWKWSFMERGMISAISRSLQASIILLSVGILIATWKAGGIIPSMIYYGLNILNPSIFLVSVCILCSIVSLCLGSSYTTAGTIGVAMIGVSIGLGVDPAMTAGAVVAGSYFGDKMSPLSDTTNLAPAIAGTNLFDHIRHMAFTVTPSMLIALVVYAVIGRGTAGAHVSVTEADLLQSEILNEFTVSPLLLLPILILIVIVVLKIPALPGIYIGIFVGLACMTFVQGISIADWFPTMHYGYNSISEVQLNADYMVADLLGGGGFHNMLWSVSVILCSMSFGGVMEATGMLNDIAEKVLQIAKNTGSLVAVTICSCILVNMITADQYLAIILPGRMYRTAFEDRRLKAKNLSRCLEDSATLTSPLIPWNVCGATMKSFLGVPTAAYAPYAVLNWINPLISTLYGFLGFTMEKMSDEEYQEILEQRKLDAELAAKAVQ